MGGAFALRAAEAEPGRWNALIVVSSFDALEPVIDRVLNHSIGGLAAVLDPGLIAAVRWRGGFWLGDVRPVECARRLRRLPTLVVHGDADDLIPPRQGEQLFQAIAHPDKAWLRVNGALHGNVLGTPQHVFAGMAAWYAQWLGPAAGRAGSVRSTSIPATKSAAERRNQFRKDPIREGERGERAPRAAPVVFPDRLARGPQGAS